MSAALSPRRSRRITSTRAPAIMGCDPGMGRHGAARQILGIDDEVEATGPMERGRFLEEGTSQWFVHRMAKESGRSLELIKPPFMTHPQHDWLGSSIDRLVYESGDLVGALEAKNYLSDRRFEYGEPWTDQVDERTLIQCVVHMAVATPKLPRCFVPLVTYDLSIYVVQFDAELEAAMIFQCGEFWREWIVPNLERLDNGASFRDLSLPPVDGHDGTVDWIKSRWKQSRGDMLEATPETRELANALAEAKRVNKAAETEKKRLENEMRLAIGEAAGISFGDDGAATWRANKNGVRALRLRLHGDSE